MQILSYNGWFPVKYNSINENLNIRPVKQKKSKTFLYKMCTITNFM